MMQAGLSPAVIFLVVEMVEITNIGVIAKIQEALGLRGKAVVSSRNSVYPCVIVNADNQPIPQKPPMISTSGNTTIIMQANARSAGTFTPYTVPEGKVAYLICATLSQGTTNNTSAVIQNSASAETYRFMETGVVGIHSFYPPVPLKLIAGDKIVHVVNTSGSCVLSLFGWEENA